MGNDIENGSSHPEKEHPIIPENGLVKVEGVLFRSIEGQLFRVRTGEEMAQQMSRAEDDFMNEFCPQDSIIKSPLSIVPEGRQKHTRIIPQSPDDI